MLLFIHLFSVSLLHSNPFKYISCYCLSRCKHIVRKCNPNSNTSHVIVYPSCMHIQRRERQIQIHLMLLFIPSTTPCFFTALYSNTSHVIVYPKEFGKNINKYVFKYISCYCLSRKSSSETRFLQKFKYISCYCLSPWRQTYRYRQSIQIHLMLLFIQSTPETLRSIRKIQIHLMLLFITKPVGQAEQAIKFKYISCYCLSAKFEQYRKNKLIQIHLMLLFII